MFNLSHGLTYKLIFGLQTFVTRILLQLFKMKYIFTLFLCFIITQGFSQLEITTGYAVNKNLADGIPIQVAYDFKISNRLYTKPQIGFKYLYHHNEYVDAVAKFSIFELHQTISYEVIKKEKYILKPNIGLNYRFFYNRGKMNPPYNALPQRAWVFNGLVLNSFDGEHYDERYVNVMGFSFHLQSQIRINSNIWFHVTPFLEPDYDRRQNTGGCYVGIIFKRL